MAISIRGHVLNATQMDAIKGLIERNARQLMDKGVFQRAAEAQLRDAGCPLPPPLPAPINLGNGLYGFELQDGPWAGQKVTFKHQPKGDPHTLPMRVNGQSGRYNMNTGAWVPAENQQ